MLDALEHALGGRQAGHGLIHHSDRGSRYLSIRYSERLAEVSIEASVGSVATPTTTPSPRPSSGLYKAEVIHARGPWRTHDAVECAALEWVGWLNHGRLMESISSVPLAEYEQACYRLNESQAMAA